MRRFCLLVAFLGWLPYAKGQRNVSFAASANFDFAARGLGANNAGFGATIHSTFFNKSHIRLRTEAGIDHFIGDKLLLTDATGNALGRNPTFLAARAGVEVPVFYTFSFAALYGLTHFKWEGETVNSNQWRLLLAGAFGKGKKGLLSFSFYTLPQTTTRIQFFALGVGYRVL